MHEPLNKTTVADMADRAALEIERLRNVNGALAPKARAYDMVETILGLLPRQGEAFSEDIAYRLRARARELREGDDSSA